MTSQEISSFRHSLLDQPVWHQQSGHFQSHWEITFFPFGRISWTLNEVYKCIFMILKFRFLLGSNNCVCFCHYCVFYLAKSNCHWVSKCHFKNVYINIYMWTSQDVIRMNRDQNWKERLADQFFRWVSFSFGCRPHVAKLWEARRGIKSRLGFTSSSKTPCRQIQERREGGRDL